MLRPPRVLAVLMERWRAYGPTCYGDDRMCNCRAMRSQARREARSLLATLRAAREREKVIIERGGIK